MSKLQLCFTHRSGPIFKPKTDFSDLQCKISTFKMVLET